jgi:hypothetical protein
MKSAILFVCLLTIAFTSLTQAATKLEKSGKYGDNNFKTGKKTANLWYQIPFFAGGDIGQFETTMSQDRDSVRKMFWNDLMSEIQKLAKAGAVVEKMIEPMANILLKFDQVHDIHKAKDIINIDFSLENQFKAALDKLYQVNDIRDSQRKLQISQGTNGDLLAAYIRKISVETPLGISISQQEINVKKALEMYEQIDYISYGTFSSLGKGNFQLTFHIVGNKNGITRNFISRGKLVVAVDQLAREVFDFFQANVYEEWKSPYEKLTWLPMPKNEERQRQINETNDWNLYSFNEAKSYCQARGYRLPFAKELLMAESGTKYQAGGIQALYPYANWAVADRRESNENSWAIPANAGATNGIFMGDGSIPMRGVFWCVKGSPDKEIVLVDKIWSLKRKYRNKNLEVYNALETLRFELADYGANSGELIFWNGEFIKTENYESVDEALLVLAKNGIMIDWQK